MAKLDPEASAEWASTLDNTGQGLLIADPLGNVIMRYDEAAEMRGVHKDLERLLKYSWIH